MITLTPQQRLILIAALGKYGIADALETLGVENTPETRRRVKDQRNEIIEACDADRIVISTPSAKLRSLLVPLPDDNADRADRGEAALLTTDYDGINDNDRDTYMGDVLANLMHLANREGLDFDNALARAENHYEAEIAEAAEAAEDESWGRV